MMTLNGKHLKRQQVKDAILKNIREGALEPGERILPVDKLAKTLKVSSTITHQALRELVEDDMLECRGIRGFYVSPRLEAPAATETPANNSVPSVPSGTKVFLSCGHHSDLVWKWGYSVYEEIRRKQFDYLAEMLERNPEFHAYVEQAETLRIYLEKCPEKLAVFQKAHREGRFTLTGGGSIPDLNLCCGESLVRNLQRGKRYFREVFGEEVEIDNRADSFGMCGQLPQILHLSGYKSLMPGRRPDFPHSIAGDVPFTWQGIDGSTVTVVPTAHPVDHLALNCNAPWIRTPEERLFETLLAIRRSDFPGNILARYETETEEFHSGLAELVARVNAEPGSRVLEFGSVADYCAALDSGELPVYSGEFNPAFTGCYTTRIGVKQAFRRAENRLFAAEMLGAGLDMPVDLGEAWHELEVGEFHDAACGCHTDGADREVMEKLRDADDAAKKIVAGLGKAFDGIFTVFNPASAGNRRPLEFPSATDLKLDDCAMQRDGDRICCCPELPPCGIRTFRTEEEAIPATTAGEPRFRTKFFEVDFSQPYPEIHSKDNVLGQNGFGEILFRHDLGSMWSERFGGTYYGREYQSEKVLSIEQGPVFIQVTTEGQVLPHPSADGSEGDYWEGFQSLKFKKIYRFYRELDYFTVKIVLDWKGNNTKISLRFPLELDVHNASALYSVPFGAMARSPYYEVEKKYRSTLHELNPETYQHAGGDWPALHWVDYSDFGKGCSLANSGTPAHQLVNGNIIVSLLRSGTMLADGFLAPQPGAFDNGIHEYEFAVRPHSAKERDSVPRTGELLNREPVVFPGKSAAKASSCSFLAIDAPNVVISSFRATESGKVLRIYESLGRKTMVLLTLPENCVLSESDLEEREWRPVPKDKIVLTPFEIKTLKIQNQ